MKKKLTIADPMWHIRNLLLGAFFGLVVIPVGSALLLWFFAS